MMAVSPDKAVMTSAMVTLASTVGFSAAPKPMGGAGEFPSPRLLIGTGITFMGLGILADYAPGFAVPLSAAIAITALTYYGIPVLNKAFTDNPGKGKK